MKTTLRVLFVLMVLYGCSWGQRLPHIVVPEHYALKLSPDFASAKFGGEEIISVHVLQPTATIMLNAVDITFHEVTVTSGGLAQNAAVTLQPKQELATLTVAKPLPTGDAEIRIRYTGVLNDNLRGFYLAEAEGHKYAVTQFEPTDARRAFPCFDEPAYKAVFDITVVAPVGDTAISNGRIIADEPGPGPNQHTMRFSSSPKMSTYLVAFLVGSFECLQGSADNVPIRVCTPPGKQAMGRFALTASENFLKFYDRYFAIKYPYTKLDLIAIPDFEAGAMENTAAITFRDVALLVDEKSASVPALKEKALVIAHEMAHQWFGDLVTMSWWNDIWLNEGFATWMETKPVAAWRPEWHMDMDEQLSAEEAMSSDALRNTRPIRQPAETSAQINELFDAIAYNKTAAVLRMLEAYEGPQVFERGVNNYLQAHAYANASAEDFWAAEAASSNQPVDRIMTSFVKNPGVPVVSAEFHCATGKSSITLRQRRFSFEPSTPAKNSNEVWAIPVCIRQPGAQNTEGGSCKLLTRPQQTFELQGCAGFTFLNAGARGYYRSGYTRPEISDIGSNVEQQLTPIERLSLLDNEWALVRAGDHRIDALMTLAEALKNDRTPATMTELGRHLRHVTDYLVTAQDRGNYEHWVRGLLQPAMAELGAAAAPNDTDERRALRAAVFYTLGYSGRDLQVLQQAWQLLRMYMKDGSSVDPTLLDPVFTLSAMQGTPALYDEFVARSKTASSPDTYYRYLYALAEFSDPALLKRTLEYALSPAVRRQDTVYLVGAVLRNPAGRDLGWQFVQTHWNALQEKSSIYAMAAMVRFAGSFCTANAGEQVRKFFHDHPVPAAERGLRQTLEKIQNCADLRSQQEPALASWLSQRPSAAGQ